MFFARTLTIFTVLLSQPVLHASQLMVGLERCQDENPNILKRLADVDRFSAEGEPSSSAELAWRQTAHARDLAALKWSTTLCVYQALEVSVDPEIQLRQLDAYPASRQAMAELAIYMG